MSLRNCLIVVWVYVVYVIGTWLFISGYLMKHFVVFQNSSLNVHVGSSISCKNFSSLHTISDEFLQNLVGLSTEKMKNSHLQRFDKAIIIIIDALRFDFVVNSTFVKKEEEFHSNKLPIFSQLLKKFPQNAALFHLVADPPTTTLQRLKAITTGSLPSFIDISQNFASSEIMEDNLIRQINQQNKSVVFMGDDTWDSVFPNQFTRSYAYPSFNVKDLDTVDNGILYHIYDEINKNSADVLIAHFLGVDHCGHRYGPRHPEMSRKLSQMNDVVEKISEIVNNDTILIVLGDHGMTNSGDHGGDSTKETSTALFLYSPSKIVFNKKVHTFPAVPQINIVPTLSLLLGLPIPFSNIGSTIPFLFTLNSNHCFDENIDALLGSTLAAIENTLQIHRYLKAYHSESKEIEDSFIITAENKLKNISYLWKNITSNIIHNIELISKMQKGYEEYNLSVYNLFVKKWATFDIKCMIMGLIVLCIAASFNILSAEQINKRHLIIVSATIASICIIFVAFRFFLAYFLFFIIFTISCAFFTFVFFFKAYFIQCISSLLNVQSLILFLLFICSFSNSFIIYEDRVVFFLLQSIILYRHYPIIINFFKYNFQTNKTRSYKHNQKFKCAELLLLVCLMFCIRIGFLFFKCREEQINCVNTDFILAFEKMHMSQSYKILRLFLSLSSVIIPVVIFLYLSSYKSTSKSHTAIAMIIRYGIFFICVFTSLRWWLNIVSPDAVERILKGNEIALTRAAFSICIIISVILFLFPILSEEPWTLTSRDIYSESLGTFLFIISQFLHLIAGDAISSAVMLMSISILLHVILSDYSRNLEGYQIWTDVLIWNFSSRYWFYASAHQATFSSIQWDAAFILNHKEIYSFALSGALVTLNTFSSNILFGLAFPALLVWSQPIACSSTSIRRLHLKYAFCSGVKVVGHAVAAFILRRHLMAVSIFCPRLIYEILGMIVTVISTCIGHCFILTVISQYHKFIRKNLGHMFSDKSQ